MLLLITKALATLSQYSPRNIGRLITPHTWGSAHDTPRAGFLWAADNGCYQGLDEAKYRRMLEGITDVPGCLFVTVPDVVGDAEATMALFRVWHDTVATTGPIGLVAQDGLTPNAVPWTDIAALFIGGTTEWKLGEDARLLMKEAKARGKWLHMGRVNSWRRMEYAKACDVDSIDGTQFSWFSDRWIDKFAEMATTPRQGTL